MMPDFFLNWLEGSGGDICGRTVCIMGVSYRAGVKEDAYSGAHVLRDSLIDRGAKVVANDPLYSAEEIRMLGFEPLESPTDVFAIIFHTDAVEFKSLSSTEFPNTRWVLDGRSFISKQLWSKARVISF